MDEIKGTVLEDGVTRYPHTRDIFGARPVNEEQPLAEKPIHLDGSVALISVFGSDEMIVKAARVSYRKGTKRSRDTRDLLRYLMRHKHTSPFEQAEVQFYLKMPIFGVRQLIRHRTANVNESSARYSELSEDFYVPAVGDVGKQLTTNKQGTGEPLTTLQAEQVRALMVDAQAHSNDIYRTLLDKYGVSREQARIVTSVGVYSELFWKCDLHNFFHFLKLRTDLHAQKEIRDFADAMYDCVRVFFPFAFEAWEDYVRDAYTLSAAEIRMLGKLLAHVPVAEFDKRPAAGEMSEREFSDFKFFLDTTRQ